MAYRATRRSCFVKASPDGSLRTKQSSGLENTIRTPAVPPSRPDGLPESPRRHRDPTKFDQSCASHVTSEVIDLYIEDPVRLLPRRQRDDTATSFALSSMKSCKPGPRRNSARSVSALSLVREYG